MPASRVTCDSVVCKRERFSHNSKHAHIRPFEAEVRWKTFTAHWNDECEKKLESRIPKYIPKPDRVWMALAAYNVGFSHLRDARGVTAWINDNPNRWSGVSKALPLLSKKKYYKRLPNGYARGWQPVIYVNRIRNYHDLLLEALEK